MNNNIEEKLKTLPDKSGVYIMKNSDEEIIYVGKAKILKNRVRQYFKGHNHSLKVSRMVENIADFEYIITDTEQEALILENNLIKQNSPKYNILLKDDKTYPFIKITMRDDFPRILITRRVVMDGSRYFGPYCSNLNVKELVELVSDFFCMRKCKKNIYESDFDNRPCLYYQMGKCSAPCCGKISKHKYREAISGAVDFLNGKQDHITSELTCKMKEAAQKFDFETAALFRDRIKSISIISEKQKVVSATEHDYDAIATYNQDDNACVEVFFVRSGKIVGKEHYFLYHTEYDNIGTIIGEFIKQYYETSTFIPPLILVQTEVDESESIEQWLSEKTGRNVKLNVPKIGDKFKLLEMIASNAKKEHSERQLKIMRDISFKNNALVSLQKLINADKAPMNIEAYDISNISGSAKVGAMVTFAGGKPDKSKYRNFKIKYVSGQDDYKCMEEVVSRRIERGLSQINSDSDSESSFLPFPDLILVDGGLGHVKVVRSVLQNYDLEIPVFGIVKDDRHRTEGLVSADGAINIDKSSEAFMLLTRIQDEMHRRAITYHRSIRDKSSLKSELLKIKGVGNKKARILLKHFKSVKKVKDAPFESLLAIDGIDESTARNVYSYFNGN